MRSWMPSGSRACREGRRGHAPLIPVDVVDAEIVPGKDGEAGLCQIALATLPERRHRVQILRLTGRLFSSTLTFLILGRQIFLVFLLEWLTLFPICIVLPHTSHFAIAGSFQTEIRGIRAPRAPRHAVWCDTIDFCPIFFNYFMDILKKMNFHYYHGGNFKIHLQRVEE